MLDGIWHIVEMRGPSAISILLIGFLFYLFFIQRNQIKKLSADLESTEKDLYRKIEKTLDKSMSTIVDCNSKIVELQIEVGKLTEGIKGICKSLDEVKAGLMNK